MRKKVRKSLAFLLALALVVSVMSGLGLSVSADDAQNEPVVTETEGEPAEEKPKVEESTPKEGEEEEEATDPAVEAVPKEKKDVKQTTEGEGSGEKAAENKAAETPKAGENVQTATIGTGDKTVTVKTTAAAGVLPEGAKLVVKKLANQDQAYQDAESTLKDSQVTYDDFLALDVGFEVNGKEVEPEAGSVQVQFELGAGLLPETADTSTLAVQHLTDGKAETVADVGAVTAGDVTVNGEVIKADFEVKSFSNFTITWTIRETDWWKNTYFKKYFELTVTYLDEDGKEINPSASNVELTNDKEINFFKTYGKSITGYDFVGAYYGSYTKGVETTKITSLKTSTDGYDNYSRTYSIYFYRDGSRVDAYTLTQNQVTDSTDVVPKTANIKLVFKKDTTGDTGGTIGDITLPAPGHTKKAVSNGDGTYDLSLDVSGSIGSEAKKIPLDVVMIIDKSNSMNDDNKLTTVKSAATNLVKTLDGNNGIDVRYNIVQFGGAVDPTTSVASSSGWEKTASEATRAINGVNTPSNQDLGGTNYQAGIRVAKQQLNLARAGAQTVVIFFTDGIPTFRLSSPKLEYYKRAYGYDYNMPRYYGAGNHDDNNYNINAAAAEIKGMYTNRFYAVGKYSKDEKTQGANNLQELVDNVNASSKQTYVADNTSQIEGIFNNISSEILELTCTNVSITDTLNENAQIVKNVDGQTPLTITVTNKSGTVEKETGYDNVSLIVPSTKQNGGEEKDRTLTATYVEDENGRQIKLIFPEKYSLEADYTYTVTTPIEPTEKAYEKYRYGKETYPNTPDAGTGTHAEKRENGFYCNDTAQLKYNNTKGDKTVAYDKPVIQLTPGKLVIKKTIAGELTEAQVKALEENLTFKYTLNKGEEQNTKLTDWTENADGTYTASATVASGLSPDTMYTVTEDADSAKVEGYDVVRDPVSDSGTIGKGVTKTASFTNTYTKATQDLTITKVIKNLSPNAKFGLDKSKTYTFTVTADADMDVAGNTYTIEGSEENKVSFNGQVATVTIQGEGSIKIKDLPVGDYTVEEQKHEDVTGYDFVEATYAPIGGKETLTSTTAGQVTVTNKYKIKQVQVKVKKKVTGNMYDSKDEFGFTVNKTKDAAKLSDGQEKTFTVDYGSTFTVTEQANSKGYKLTRITDGEKNVTIENDGYTIKEVTAPTTITFYNDKTIQPPNGIITTIAPYAIMVVLAAGAGVYFVYSRRRRNG